MTPRELGGWVPAELHQHFDNDDQPTGYTIIQRESRIDDLDRSDLLALAQYEAETCGCGYHPSVADLDENVFKPEVRKCPVCAGKAQWERMLQDEDEAAAKASPNAPGRAPRPSDGRYPYMRLLSPDEAAELREQNSRPPRRNPA